MIPSSTVLRCIPWDFSRSRATCTIGVLPVQIVNFALRMMNGRRFDVPRFWRRQPRAVGIDLHWMPHAHGALEVARLIKEGHPEVPVIFGGLPQATTTGSSSIIRRWTSSCAGTARSRRSINRSSGRAGAVTRGRSIPNLTWKTPGRGERVNAHTFLPDNARIMSICDLN